jgi:MFS family permease
MGPVAQEPMEAESVNGRRLMESVRDGLRFVIRQPIILSSMLLDFFATFFSSARYLLPIFATQILGVGVVGYGWLVAAPAIGAGFAAILLAFYRSIRNQGPLLLICVAGFGIATITFGLSNIFWLTFVALTLTGVTDSISTIIRNTIRQILTPDNMRGRMTSVNQMFFRGGPLFGEVEAGVVAQWFGAPFAVVSGGIACLLSVGFIAARFPQLRAYNGDEPIVAGRTVPQPSN